MLDGAIWINGLRYFVAFVRIVTVNPGVGNRGIIAALWEERRYV